MRRRPPVPSAQLESLLQRDILDEWKVVRLDSEETSHDLLLRARTRIATDHLETRWEGLEPFPTIPASVGAAILVVNQKSYEQSVR